MCYKIKNGHKEYWGSSPMKRFILYLLIFILCTVCFNHRSFAYNNATEKIKSTIEKLRKAEEKGYIEDEIIVVFKPKYTQTLASLEHKEVLSRVSLKLRQSNLNFKKVRRLGPKSRFFLIKLDKQKETVESARSKLLKSPDIEVVEPITFKEVCYDF